MKTFLDTNILIYLLEGNPDFGDKAAKLLTDLKDNGHEFYVSTATIAELLANSPDPNAEHVLLNFPNLTFVDLSPKIAVEAGNLSRKHSLRLGDGIQLATAIEARCENIATNDLLLSKIAALYMKVESI